MHDHYLKKKKEVNCKINYHNVEVLGDWVSEEEEEVLALDGLAKAWTFGNSDFLGWCCCGGETWGFGLSSMLFSVTDASETFVVGEFVEVERTSLAFPG